MLDLSEMKRRACYVKGDEKGELVHALRGWNAEITPAGHTTTLPRKFAKRTDKNILLARERKGVKNSLIKIYFINREK